MKKKLKNKDRYENPINVTDMDSLVSGHIKKYISEAVNPIGSSIVCGLSETKINIEHMMDYILEKNTSFDIAIDNNCDVIKEGEEE